jgi:paraquat-inducible protein B
LQVGSDVRFGGVRIGRVHSINVIIDTKENRKIIPVVVELTEKELRAVAGGAGGLDFSSDLGVLTAVRDGLRAGMKQQSLVTGQLYIEFDIVPGAPGFIYDSLTKPEYPVVPTIPTEFDELISGITDGLKKINELDLQGVMTEMRDVLRSANKQIEGVDLAEINDNLTAITRDIRNITGDEKLPAAIANLEEALAEIRSLSIKVNANVDPLMEEVQGLAESTRASLLRIEATADGISKTADGISRTTDPRAPMLLQWQNLVNETETAVRSIQELANDLKRNPNTLLWGRATP